MAVWWEPAVVRSLEDVGKKADAVHQEKGLAPSDGTQSGLPW